MGDSDASSNAAQGAQADDAEDRPGFFRWLFEGMGGTSDEDGTDGQATPVMARQTHGLANLRRMRVDDVSIPKADIVAVPDSITKDELVKVFRDTGLTRLPVYSGTLDTPIGMAHLKDFALMHGFNGKGTRFNLKKMLRPLLFVPPSMPIGVLLTKMQTERRHMALVIDEYGGVDGLVTIEDLIEQVIGEIEDEHDTEEGKNWRLEKPGCYLVLAKTQLEEFEAEIGLDLTEDEEIDGEEIETLGGLVFVLAGHVPARGEVVPHPAGLEFEVVEADPRRIKRLRVRMPGAQGTAVAASVRAQGAQTGQNG
ncbi:magnesium and cobalt transporter [Roseivivax lentus]|uniref:Magnesium and cobalt transporter n=1 Tax=Roseivivax lentus TaxID=633194 RepID=A0A1N7PPP1_9RHOB|nr:hemolysin family protein [Roseivivax lentus]SIT12389.1 magnesium and cobalt transporter [Roseivivax lentus]